MASKCETLLAEAQFAFAVEDQEHLFFLPVRVERALRLAGWQFRQVIAKLLRANTGAEKGASGGVEPVLLDVVERNVIQIHEGLGHIDSG